MIQIRLVSKELDISLSLPKIKYIIGRDYSLKDKMCCIFDSYFDKEKDSEYAIEHQYRSCIYLDDSPLNIADFNYFHVSKQYDLENELKLGTKSLFLKFLNVVLDKIEYTEEYQTFDILYGELLRFIEEQIEERFNGIQINIDKQFYKKNLVKYLLLNGMMDDLEVNQYDLSLESKIIFQLQQIQAITEKSNKKTIILYDCDYVSEEIYELINELNDNVYVIAMINEVLEVKDYREIYICKDNLDLYDDNKIYEMCMNYNRSITIEEYRNMLMEQVNEIVKR